ncbi:conjugative transposon protein TraM [Seonamhaeicola marinus]|uniref:Conjugative transposon protein TraM n=1 Tax=Seonamhaeicola marinus TaxID=1912246 RepID=A0A5D0J1T2_9FLAO|nr:conjugative transposon protein TraM [Seonamhaeicola marinus]TYA89178.1 conjugative transposon protein TraM [Seonamhaeicola marinus]
MTLEKNKIVFALVVMSVVLFIGAYAALTFGEEPESGLDHNTLPVPELTDEQKEYKSKLEALDNLKEVKQTNAPSIYEEYLLDSMGVYDANLLEKEKKRIVDSIYNDIRFINSIDDDQYENDYKEKPLEKREIEKAKSYLQAKDSIPIEPKIDLKELGLEHQLFFASDPIKNGKEEISHTDSIIYARVDGTQMIKQSYRLQMRLTKEALINNKMVPRNTPVYAFVSFKPNRTLLTIENVNHQPVKLNAFDLQDGAEGIYIENSFQAEARREVVGDVVDDINIVGVPQVSGIKRIFRRNNNAVKVTIEDDYQLLLKPY